MYIDNTDPRFPLIMFKNAEEIAEFSARLLGLIRSPHMVVSEGIGNMLKAPDANGVSKAEDWAPGAIKAAMMHENNSGK